MTPKERIAELEAQINEAFDNDVPLAKAVKELNELRHQYMAEMIGTHTQRSQIMQEKTRELTFHLLGINLIGKPDLKEKLLREKESFDLSAVHWVIKESCQWGESEAASIAAGIVVLSAR